MRVVPLTIVQMCKIVDNKCKILHAVSGIYTATHSVFLYGVGQHATNAGRNRSKLVHGESYD